MADASMRDATDALDLLGSLATAPEHNPQIAPITFKPVTFHNAAAPRRRQQSKPRVARVPWTEAQDELLTKLVTEL